MRKIIFSISIFLTSLQLLAAPPVSSNGVMYSCDREQIAKEFHDLTGDGEITVEDRDCIQQYISGSPLPPDCKSMTTGTGSLHYYDINGSCEEPGHTYPCVTTLDLITITKYLNPDPVIKKQGILEMGHVTRTYERRFCNNPPAQPCTADQLAQQSLDLYDDGVIDAKDSQCIQHYVLTGGYPGSSMPGCVPAERTPENYGIAFQRYNQIITSTYHATILQAYVLGMITAEELPEVSQAAAIHNCIGAGTNDPPIITLPESLPKTFKVFSNELFSLSIQANDPEGNPLQNYTATSLSTPPLSFGWDTVSDPPVFSYTPTPSQETNSFQFLFTVDDDLGQTAMATTAIDVFPFSFEVLKTPGDPGTNMVINPNTTPVLTNTSLDPGGAGVIVQIKAPSKSVNHQNEDWTYTLTSVSPALPPGLPSPTLSPSTGHLTIYNTTPPGIYDIGVRFDDGFNVINRLIRFNIKQPLEFTYSPAPMGGGPPADTYYISGSTFHLDVGHNGGISPVGLSMTSTNLPGANYTWDAINGYLDIFNIGTMGSGPFQATFQLVDSQTPNNETITQTIHFVLGSSPLAFEFTPAPTHGGPPLDTYYLQGNITISVNGTGGAGALNLNLTTTTLPPAAFIWSDFGSNGTLEINFASLGTGPYTAQFELIDSGPPLDSETFTLNFIVGPPPGMGITFNPAPPGTPEVDTYYVEENTVLEVTLGHENGIDPVNFSVVSTTIPITNYRLTDTPASPPGVTDFFQFDSAGLASTINGSPPTPYVITFRAIDSESPTPSTVDKVIYIHVGLPGYPAWYDTQLRYAQWDNVLIMQPGPNNHTLYRAERPWVETVTLVNLQDFLLEKREYTGSGSPYTNEYSICKSNLANQSGVPRNNWDLNIVTVNFQCKFSGKMSY